MRRNERPKSRELRLRGPVGLYSIIIYRSIILLCPHLVHHLVHLPLQVYPQVPGPHICSLPCIVSSG